MRLSLHCVGRLKSGPEKILTSEYAGRIEAICRQAGLKALTPIEHMEAQGPNAAIRKADEAERLLSRIPADAFIIALDEHGREFSSQDFASFMQEKRDQGASELAFVIGGPDGHGDAILQRAGLKLAFGRLTWPHRLMRILLNEQIYRAITILLNHPYHRV